MYTGLDKLGLAATGLALAAVPVAGLWLAVSLWLSQLARRRQPGSTPAEAPVLAPAADAAR
jgi:ATP:ADP antiporter, AAA family